MYLQLASDPRDRGDAYRALFAEGIPEEQLAAIRKSLERSRALGGEAFCAAIETVLGRNVRVVPQGRPRKH